MRGHHHVNQQKNNEGSHEKGPKYFRIITKVHTLDFEEAPPPAAAPGAGTNAAADEAATGPPATPASLAFGPAGEAAADDEDQDEDDDDDPVESDEDEDEEEVERITAASRASFLLARSNISAS